MLFKVLTGTFRTKDGVYRKGDEVEINRDLCKLFPYRFELLRDDPHPSRPAIPTMKHSPLVSVGGEEKSEPPTELSPDEEMGDVSDNATPTVVQESWDNMTDDFPTASQLGFQVYHDGATFQIVNPKFNKVLSRRKPPKTAKAVNAILNKYLEK